MCNTDIEVADDYEAEICCSGYMCGCYGKPVNPVLCDKCEEQLFGKSIN